MRIGIDARELSGKPTGVGRHLLGLLNAWAIDPRAASHTFVLYAPESVTTPLPNAAIRVIPGPPGTMWEQRALPRAARGDGLDVFLAPGYTAPLTLDVPIVVVVHDISFVAHPEWFRWREGLRRRTLTRWSSHRAALVLTESDFARQEILLHFGLSPGRVRRIYPGVTSLHEGQHRNTREPLILFVGSVFNRRHLPELIRAFKPVARKHAETRLTIVGDNRTYPYQDLAAIVAGEGLRSNVSIRPYVPDDELAGLFRRARVFALLSEYEGFGHPPLEALACGVPPLLLESEVAREVMGDAALYATLDDPGRITAALETLLFDEATRSRLLAAAPNVLARYSWPRAASETMTALEDAARA